MDNAKEIDLVMPMYNLIEHSDNYSKTSGGLWQYYRDEPAIDNNNSIIDFAVNNNNSISLKFKEKITGQTENDGPRDFDIMVPLKYLSNFWRTLEMSLIDCESSFVITRSANHFTVLSQKIKSQYLEIKSQHLQ